MNTAKTTANLILNVILPIAKKKGISLEDVATQELVKAMVADIEAGRDTFQNIKKCLE